MTLVDCVDDVVQTFFCALEGKERKDGYKAVDQAIVDYVALLCDDEENTDDFIAEIICSLAVEVKEPQNEASHMSLAHNMIRCIRHGVKDSSVSVCSRKGHSAVLQQNKKSKKKDRVENLNMSIKSTSSNEENRITPTDESSKDRNQFREKGLRVELRLLAELAPHVPETLLEFCLVTVAYGDANKAAQYIFENDVAHIAQAHQRYQLKLENALKEEHEAKEREIEARLRMLDRYGDEEIIYDDDESKSKQSDKQVPRKNKLDERERIRYLDGQIVSRKGEKVILIPTKEEWDGGSRGRVKTKGKRGKGWIGT